MSTSIRSPLTWTALIIAGLLLAGCGAPDDQPPPPAPAEESQPATETAPEPAEEPRHAPAPESVPEPSATEADVEVVAPEDAVSVDDDGTARVTIGSTDQMRYTVQEFAVDAGQEVELTLVHEGRLALNVMGHNVVILPAGEDYIAFSRRVMSEGGSIDNEYLPESMRDGLIAYTSMIAGGDTDTIRFTAPEEPGDYPFLCTFPGHFGVMNGVMTVR